MLMSVYSVCWSCMASGITKYSTVGLFIKSQSPPPLLFVSPMLYLPVKSSSKHWELLWRREFVNMHFLCLPARLTAPLSSQHSLGGRRYNGHVGQFYMKHLFAFQARGC